MWRSPNEALASMTVCQSSMVSAWRLGTALTIFASLGSALCAEQRPVVTPILA